jgi:chemotaxis protein CheD
MEESKIDIKTLGAKVFGGAGLIASNSAVKDKIGRRNIEVALGTLAKEGIKVISRDTGGSKGRKLFLNSKTKEVLIKKLQ